MGSPKKPAKKLDQCLVDPSDVCDPVDEESVDSVIHQEVLIEAVGSKLKYSISSYSIE